MRRATVIGAGISGAVSADILKREGYAVTVIERASEVGGNCRDVIDCDGSGWHVFGPHVFHTNDPAVEEWAEAASDWIAVRPRVRAEIEIGDMVAHVPLPFNDESEEIVRSAGYAGTTEELVRESVFGNYSRRMWGMPEADIPASVKARLVPRREGREASYHLHRFCGVPVGGYSRMISRLLDGCDVLTGVECEVLPLVPEADVFCYTGSPDELFGYSHGPLPYRTLGFLMADNRTPWTKWHKGRTWHQTNNCAPQGEWSRVFDYGALLGRGLHDKLVVETPGEWVPGLPRLYPLRWTEAAVSRAPIYAELVRSVSREHPGFYLTGRLARYSYQDMDVAVKCAILSTRKAIERNRT